MKGLGKIRYIVLLVVFEYWDLNLIGGVELTS